VGRASIKRKSEYKNFKLIICMEFFKILLSFFIIFFFSLTSLKAQKILNEQEIFNEWLSQEGVLKISKQQGFIDFINFDTSLNMKIYTALENLHQLQIDTLGFFISAYPGFIAKDSCDKGRNYPVKTFIFWQYKGNYFFKLIRNICDFNPQQSDSISIFFDFYKNNLKQISTEYIMPVIFKGEIDCTGNFTYEYSESFHQPEFFLFCQIGKDFKFLKFTQDDLTNKENIFYEYNINSKSYLWFNKINTIVGLPQKLSASSSPNHCRKKQ
jgi:hypothetical protein